MAERRETPYIWVTWLTELMAGERDCEWASWFKAQHEGRSWEPVPDKGLALWKLKHTALLEQYRAMMEDAGCTVTSEGQNKFVLKGQLGNAERTAGPGGVERFRSNHRRYQDWAAQGKSCDAGPTVPVVPADSEARIPECLSEWAAGIPESHSGDPSDDGGRGLRPEVEGDHQPPEPRLGGPKNPECSGVQILQDIQGRLLGEDRDRGGDGLHPRVLGNEVGPCGYCDYPGGPKTYASQVKLPLDGRVRCIDYCIHHIVAALNAAGVYTESSCCGHGIIKGIISLEDGADFDHRADP